MPKTALKPIIAANIGGVLSANAENFVIFSNQTGGSKLTVGDCVEHRAQLWQVDDNDVGKLARLAYYSEFFGKRKTKWSDWDTLAFRTIANLVKQISDDNLVDDQLKHCQGSAVGVGLN